MVAVDGSTLGCKGERVQSVSADEEFTATISCPFVGVASASLGSYSRGFFKQDVPAVTIEKLRAMFAVHGLPETLVSDNGTVFTSAEFKEFLQRNNIQHIRTAPYHPASNGQAERAVQTFKNGMKRSSKDTLETRVSRFLFHYRITPNTTTGVSPAELLMGRSLRSHFSMLHTAVEARVASS